MPTNSDGKIVRRRAADIPPISPGRLAEIRAIPDEDIDTSDIPEQTGERRRLERDVDGRLPRRSSPIREAIAAEMARRGMTAYALWKGAKARCPTITETAVGQFLKGRRSIGIEYLEAILAALGLVLHNPNERPAISAPESIREEPPIPNRRSTKAG